MAQTMIVQTNTLAKLLPLYRGIGSIELPVNLAPSTVFAKGTVLGPVATTSANDVQTLTVTGTPTGGSATVTVTHPLSGNPVTFDLVFNSTNTQAQVAARAALGGTFVTVTGGPLPGSTLVFTFSGLAAAMPVALMTISVTGLTGGTPAATFAHTTIGRSLGTYAAYVDTTIDPATCILPWACATDGAGNITYGAAATGGQWGETFRSTTAYFGGYFDTTQLVGLDAAGVVNLGRLISGTAAAGVLCIGVGG